MDDRVVKLKALADPVRLAILDFVKTPDAACCVSDHGVCACDIENVLGLSQPTVSYHMKLLVRAGLVNADKRGKWVYYEIDPQGVETVTEYLRSLSAGASGQPVDQREPVLPAQGMGHGNG